MGLAIGDINLTVFAHEDAVRAGEATPGCGTVGAIAALTGADHRGNNAGLQIDSPDGVALGIGEVKTPIGRPGDTLGPGEARQLSRAAVAVWPVSPVPAT